MRAVASVDASVVFLTIPVYSQTRIGPSDFRWLGPDHKIIMTILKLQSCHAMCRLPRPEL
jgi:hypothetical protein